jgi:hypothetical protein
LRRIRVARLRGIGVARRICAGISIGGRRAAAGASARGGIGVGFISLGLVVAPIAPALGGGGNRRDRETRRDRGDCKCCSHVTSCKQGKGATPLAPTALLSGC